MILPQIDQEKIAQKSRLRVVSSFPLGDRREMRVGRGQKKARGGGGEGDKEISLSPSPFPPFAFFCPRPTLISRRSPRGKEETTRSLQKSFLITPPPPQGYHC